MDRSPPFARRSPLIAATAVRGVAVTAGTQVVRLIVQLGSVAIMARLLTPDAFGLMAMLVTAVHFLQLLSDSGLSYAAIQRDQISDAELSTLFWVNVAVGALLMLLGILAAPLIVMFYGDDRLLLPMTVLSIGFLVASSAVQHRALLSRHMRFGALSKVHLSSLILSTLLAIAMAAAGFGYWSLVAQTLASHAFEAIGAWLASGWRPRKPAWAPGSGEALRFGGGVIGFNLVNFFSRNADNILIGWRWGSIPLGFYAKSYQLVLLPVWQISGPLSSVLIPTLSRLQREPERYRKAYAGTLAKMLMLAYPLYAFCLFMADDIVLIVLGNQWKRAGTIFLLLSCSGFAQPIANTFGWLYISQGRTGEMFRVALVATVPIVSSFVLGLPYGPEGVAACYSAVFVGLMPCFIWAACRTSSPVRQRDIYKACIPGAIGAIAVAAAALAVKAAGWNLRVGLEAVLVVGLFSALSLSVTYLLVPVARAEIADLIQRGRLAWTTRGL